MDRKISGVVLALIALLFFYEPWIYLGPRFHQSGEHMSGLAQGLFYLPIAFAGANWFGHRALSLVFAWASLLVASIYLLNFGGQAAYGLWWLFALSIGFISIAFRNPKTVPPAKEPAGEGSA